MLKIAVIVGSNRRESLNRKLAEALAGLIDARAETSFIQIDDLPMYNLDHESERPETVNRFTNEMKGANAVLIVMPEYNRSLPAVLKSAIDWGSKPANDNVWKDKFVAITGTSPGAIGTAVGQQHLRQILGILGSLVMGGEAYITYKPGLIEDGRIVNNDTRDFLLAYINKFLSGAARWNASAQS
jgi:chromate reductase